ncbi:MAG: DUF445 domain-containing protein [Acidimicrobiales bacterium]|nr:DUF445 domain-containing protein [Acidimicrobiales bacterium]
MSVTVTEAERRADLRRMKRRATGLLVAATVVFVVARWLEERNSGWGYLRATAEAAMVGGLADWFAVTALFRHPLGLPIPHTAIIPERKEQLGRSLGGFVEEHFLTAELVAEKVRALRVGHRAAVWLGDPGNRATAERQLATAIGGGIEVLRDDEVQDGLEQAVLTRIRRVPAAPVAGRALELMTADGRHHDLVTAGARGIVRFVEEHRLELRSRFGRESPWWVPEPIDDRIFEKLFDGLRGFLVELADDPDHLVRDHLDRRLARLVEDLCADPGYRDRGEALKEELLAHPAVRAWTATLWQDLKAGLLAQTADPGSELRRRLADGIDGFAATLAEDAALQAKVDAWAESAVRWAVESYKSEAAELIATTVARWDPTEASERVELAVGRDLQFIRINGTIVGGLAGLVIHTVGRFIG